MIGEKLTKRKEKEKKKEMVSKKLMSIHTVDSSRMVARVVLARFCTKMEMCTKDPGKMVKWMALAFFMIKRHTLIIKAIGNQIT